MLPVVPRLTGSELGQPAASRRDRAVCAAVGEVWRIDRAAQSTEVHERTATPSASGDDEIASHAVEGFRLVPSRLFAAPEA